MLKEYKISYQIDKNIINILLENYLHYINFYFLIKDITNLNMKYLNYNYKTN